MKQITPGDIIRTENSKVKKRAIRIRINFYLII